MTSQNQQILTCYEQNGMTVEEISESLGYDIVEIKFVLMQHSRLYQEVNATLDGNDNQVIKDRYEIITDDEFDQIKRVAVDLAITSDNDAVRAKLCRYLLDEKKGRNDLKSLKKLNINVIQFNNQMQRARQAVERSKRKELLIDVEPADTKQVANG